jgi:hypothetical protein
VILRSLPFLPLLVAPATAAPTKFDFGSAKTSAGFVAVTPTDVFTAERGYGFDLGFTPKAEDRGGNPVKGDFVTGRAVSAG